MLFGLFTHGPLDLASRVAEQKLVKGMHGKALSAVAFDAHGQARLAATCACAVYLDGTDLGRPCAAHMSWNPADIALRAAMQVQRFLNAWIQGTDVVQYTPGGFAWSNAWGSLRYTANAALIAVVYASHINGELPSISARHAIRHSFESWCSVLQCILRQHERGRRHGMVIQKHSRLQQCHECVRALRYLRNVCK